MEYSTTVSNAAVQQQVNIRKGFQGMANSLTASAQGSNVTAQWPFYTMPLFESYAKTFFEQTEAQNLFVFPKVNHRDRPAWERYATSNHANWVEESNLIQYGSLKHLDTDPAKYNPFIYRESPTGPTPDGIQKIYFPAWTSSPPPSNYGSINWDVMSDPNYEKTIQALLVLQDETVVAQVEPISTLLL